MTREQALNRIALGFNAEDFEEHGQCRYCECPALADGCDYCDALEGKDKPETD
jgi:hypothetical protein